jgi:hypothetical protein
LDLQDHDGLAGDCGGAVLEADDLAVLGDVDGLDLADARAGDPDLLVLDDEAAVVEDRADLVRAVPAKI